jgi:hypothetical protein
MPTVWRAVRNVLRTRLIAPADLLMRVDGSFVSQVPGDVPEVTVTAIGSGLEIHFVESLGCLPLNRALLDACVNL